MTVSRSEVLATITGVWKRQGVVMDEQQKQEVVEIVESDGCQIPLEVGRTYNLGDYESLHIRVGIVWPCMLAKRDEAFDAAFAWVRRKLSAATPARCRRR
jgi:hypothetical protein